MGEVSYERDCEGGTNHGEVDRVSLPSNSPSPFDSIHKWKRWAWRIGQVIVANGEAWRASDYESVVANTAGFGLSPEDVLVVRDSFWTAVRRCYRPIDAPERAWKCVEWYVKRWGKPTVKLGSDIGRGKEYPTLLLLLYCLGFDGSPFAFAATRMGALAKCNPNTVRRFLQVQVKVGRLILVREGVKGKGSGQCAWYRIPMVSEIEDILRLDKRSPYKEDDYELLISHIVKQMTAQRSEKEFGA